MTMAYESTIEYADSIKELKAEILHKTQNPSNANAAKEIHQLEHDLDTLVQKEAIRSEELSNILHVNEASRTKEDAETCGTKSSGDDSDSEQYGYQ
jgi:hypothetical protein